MPHPEIVESGVGQLWAIVKMVFKETGEEHNNGILKHKLFTHSLNVELKNKPINYWKQKHDAIIYWLMLQNN